MRQMICAMCAASLRLRKRLVLSVPSVFASGKVICGTDGAPSVPQAFVWKERNDLCNLCPGDRIWQGDLCHLCCEVGSGKIICCICAVDLVSGTMICAICAASFGIICDICAVEVVSGKVICAICAASLRLEE